MSYLAKQKLYYYKKYRVDIWGFLHNTLQVLQDNTVYKVHKTFKYQKRVRNKIKQTTWLYIKHWNKFELFSNLRKRVYRLSSKKFQETDKIELIRVFENLRYNNDFILKANRRLIRIEKKRLKLFNKLISTVHRWNYFIKQTISKRACNIFNILLEKKTEDMKIFYRRPFIYEPRVPLASRRRYKGNVEYTTYRLLKLFFVIYSYKQLRLIALKAKLQSGVFEHNFMRIIESKLPSYLYRSSLFPTLFESLDFVKKGNVWVNKQYKPLIYYNVKLFDIVGFRPFYKSYIVWAFFKRLRRRAFLFSFPQCIYVSLCFLFIVLIRRVEYKDIINAFDFDYYRLTDYLQ